MGDMLTSNWVPIKRTENIFSKLWYFISYILENSRESKGQLISKCPLGVIVWTRVSEYKSMDVSKKIYYSASFLALKMAAIVHVG